MNIRCKKCNLEIIDNANFCQNCGKEIRQFEKEKNNLKTPIEIDKYPVGNTIIAILYVSSILWFINQQYAAYQLIPDIYAKATIYQWLVTIGGMLILLFSVLTLLYLKKIAIKLWLTVVVINFLNILYMLYVSYTNNNPMILTFLGIIVPVIKFLIYFIIYRYSKRLERLGYLK